MAGLKQGMKLKQNFKNKVNEAFSKKEGFEGILGPNNDMDTVIANDAATTKTSMTRLNTNIKQYDTDYNGSGSNGTNGFMKQTKLYLNNSENDFKLTKNYNLFINKSLNEDKINSKNIQGCVKLDGSITGNLSQPDGFKEAYPGNFKTYEAAENACKLWAADTNKAVYAISRDVEDKFQCRTGDGYGALTQYTKPKKLYSVVKGNSNASLGGLFGNGQIGTWSGTSGYPEMPKAILLVKYNSDWYGWGPRPVYYRIWGRPAPWDWRQRRNAWGMDIWPSNSSAWWISTDDYYYVGTMGYFYYKYTNTQQREILIFMVVDDAGELKINGVVQTEFVAIGTWGYGTHGYLANIPAGEVTFEYKLINTGGPGAFVLYAVDLPPNDRSALNPNNILFTSGPGWVYSKTDNSQQIANPYGMNTVNPVPNGYKNCDILLGGDLNPYTMTATYGKNCSTLPMAPATSCPGYSCPINGQTCLKGTSGAGNTDWMCQDNIWKVKPTANTIYQIRNQNSNNCLITGPANSAVWNNCQSNVFQQYKFIPTGEADTYLIQNTGLGNTCITATGNGVKGTQKVCGANLNMTDNVKWKLITKPETSYFQLKSKATNECLYNNADGRFDTTTGCWPGYNDQLWTLL